MEILAGRNFDYKLVILVIYHEIGREKSLMAPVLNEKKLKTDRTTFRSVLEALNYISRLPKIL